MIWSGESRVDGESQRERGGGVCGSGYSLAYSGPRCSVFWFFISFDEVDVTL